MKNKERIPVTLVQGVVKGHPQFNRKELVEKLLKIYSIEDLVTLTDNQLYNLWVQL